MTIKEQIMIKVISDDVFTADDLIRHARPAIFGGLGDEQKHVFVRMSGREQETFIEAALKGMGIRLPAA